MVQMTCMVIDMLKYLMASQDKHSVGGHVCSGIALVTPVSQPW